MSNDLTKLLAEAFAAAGLGVVVKEDKLALIAEYLKASLDSQTEVSLVTLPLAAHVLYKDPIDGFKARREKYRQSFFKEHGREVHKLTDEDYTSIKFFKEVYAPYIASGLITSGYLDRMDSALYQAITNYMRGANGGKPGRQPFEMKDIGIVSEGTVVRNIQQKLQPILT